MDSTPATRGWRAVDRGRSTSPAPPPFFLGESKILIELSIGSAHDSAFEIIACMPTRGAVCVETLCSLLSGNFEDRRAILLIASRKPVDQARNELAGNALRIANDASLATERCLIFWFDDDAAWQPAAFRRALEYMKHNPTIDLLCGNFCARSRLSPPWHWPRLDANQSRGLVEIELCGFHWVMHRPSVLDRVGAEPFSYSDGLSEDLAFCKRARDRGVRMFAAEDIDIQHVDADRALVYEPFREPMPLPGDLGATPKAWQRRTYGAVQDAARLAYPPVNDEDPERIPSATKKKNVSTPRLRLLEQLRVGVEVGDGAI